MPLLLPCHCHDFTNEGPGIQGKQVITHQRNGGIRTGAWTCQSSETLLLTIT
jgi:hypothetical protein